MPQKKKPTGGVLVPVDFSPISKFVIAHAVELADALDIPLTVLHVVHDPAEAPGYYEVKGRKKVMKRAEDVAKEILEEFVTTARGKHPDSQALRNAKPLLVVGLPVTRILEVVSRLKPSMIVMGSAGRSGLSRFLLGSKAEQVVRLCPVPVTIVKTPEEKCPS